ncbi:MAG: hypothetical protein Q7K28_00635 [Candidatus Wildermuthbacteria bacterium]|nr:hypothetical protein [Candidatus Wildermuthbacteria bacterium]
MDGEATATTFEEAAAMARAEEEAVEKERVSPLDPDFLLLALPLAMFFDGLDIILEITGIFVIPKLIGMAMDAFTLAVIGGWIYWRTKRMIDTREQQKQALQKKMGEKIGKMQQQMAKGAVKGPMKKTLTRAGIALLGELIPFVGLVPFWTISVVMTLKEKGGGEEGK